jgi:hypothetical protein
VIGLNLPRPPTPKRQSNKPADAAPLIVAFGTKRTEKMLSGVSGQRPDVPKSDIECAPGASRSAFLI